MEAQRREDQNTRFRYQVLLGQTPSYLTATEVSDVNMLWLQLYSALALASSKNNYSHQQCSDVSRGEEPARRETYILALKGVEEVPTQLPVIPWGPRRIANAT